MNKVTCPNCGVLAYVPTAWASDNTSSQWNCECGIKIDWVGPEYSNTAGNPLDEIIQPNITPSEPWVGEPTQPYTPLVPWDNRPLQPWTPPSDPMPYTIPYIPPEDTDIDDNFRKRMKDLLDIINGSNGSKKKSKKKKKVAKKKSKAKKKSAKVKTKAKKKVSKKIKAKKGPMTDKEKRDALGGCEPRSIDLCCSMSGSSTY